MCIRGFHPPRCRTKLVPLASIGLLLLAVTIVAGDDAQDRALVGQAEELRRSTDFPATERALQELLRSATSEWGRLAIYQNLFAVLEKDVGAARASGKQIEEAVKRAVLVAHLALQDVHTPNAVVFVGSDAMNLSCTIVQIPSQRSLGQSLAKDVRDTALKLARTSDALHGFTLAAKTCRSAGLYDDAERVCEEMTQYTKGRDKGPCTVAAACELARFRAPDWERCVLTLDDALTCEGMPWPDADGFCGKERMNSLRNAWLKSAAAASPKQRVMGYVTLWQRGLTARMATYWNKKTKTAPMPDLTQTIPPTDRPTKITEFVVKIEFRPAQAHVDAKLSFAKDSSLRSGVWRFIFSGQYPPDDIQMHWMLDRIEPPTAH